uniref:Colony stimulating factor 3 receptor (Granulocyte) n=1 Tax=Nothobranchius pienaari TaxID=704102 RepID=A0A1A8R5A3_9TELE
MMLSSWMLVTAVLVTSAGGASDEDDTQPCAKVHTSSSAVPLGSPVTATCVIRKDCLLVTAQAAPIEWRLGSDFIPSSPVANERFRVSKVVVSSFNHTRAVLTCGVCLPDNESSFQIYAGVEIRAGYPPQMPQNLNCQANFTYRPTLTCRWDPGLQETHLPTKYTLYTQIWDLNKNYTYELPSGVHHYTIPRSNFVLLSEMKIYVKAENNLGEAASVPIILEPVAAAKFDPPKIPDITADPKRLGCLKLAWRLSQNQEWMYLKCLNLQVQFKAAGSGQWSNPLTFPNRTRSLGPMDLCRLLPGTEYLAQIRVQYMQSPWSEWSSSKSGVTPETAPVGRLNTWMKVSKSQTHKQLDVQLFWKPSRRFRANGQNVSYVVSLQKRLGERWKVCSTGMNHCTFKLSARVKTVYLTAVNRAGASSPTEVWIYQTKAKTAVLDVTAVPHDGSFLVRWTTAAPSDLTGYVVEWRPLLKSDLSHILFEIVGKNQSSLSLYGSFEPYKPYGISVYPRFKDGIGSPQTVDAFLQQKAPDVAPKMQIKKIWKSSFELSWDEIPLEQRNGIIKDYKVFYWEDKGVVKAVTVEPKERTVILRDLNTGTLCEAFMMVSTFGGSLNGSTIHFEVEPFDVVAVAMTVITSGVGLMILIIITILTCLIKHKRLKGHFCPAVPDPANSSVKRWTLESNQYIRSSWESEEPNPVYLSHLSFLESTAILSKKEDDVWLNSPDDTSDLGESICGSPFTPGCSGSNSDSVPYATVFFSGPPLKQPHVYLRSQSTQPLLETEESFSPKCYQNVTRDEMSREQCFFSPCDGCSPEREKESTIVWDDFPFLQALAMNDAEND